MTGTDDAITLRQYVDIRCSSIEQAIAAHRQTDRDEQAAHDHAHDREHAQTQLAVSKAEESMSKRLESMNEFRAQINDERGQYVLRNESKMKDDEYDRRFEMIEKMIATQDNRWSNLNGKFAAVGVLSGMLSLLALIFALLARFAGQG